MPLGLKNRVYLHILLAAGALLSGCGSSEKNSLVCNSVDWFEIGRIDGSKGLPQSNLDMHKQRCSGELPAAKEMLYLNGRKTGLTSYCTPQNAWELGKTGKDYRGVCSSLNEELFLKKYRQGKKLYEMQMRSSTLGTEIQTLLEDVDSADSETLAELKARIKKRQSNKLFLEKQISELKKANTTL